MKKVLIAVLGFGVVASMVAQQPAPSAPPPNPDVQVQEVSALEQSELDGIHKDMVLIQQQYTILQMDAKDKATQLSQQLNARSAELTSKIASIKAAHKFGDDVNFNQQTGKFEKNTAPKNEAKPSAPAPTASKPPQPKK